MFENCNCIGCYFCHTCQDMGASWDVCDLFADLQNATLAVECNTGNCPCFVNKRKIADYVRKSVVDKIDKIKLTDPKAAREYCWTGFSEGSKFREVR